MLAYFAEENSGNSSLPFSRTFTVLRTIGKFGEVLKPCLNAFWKVLNPCFNLFRKVLKPCLNDVQKVLKPTQQVLESVEALSNVERQCYQHNEMASSTRSASAALFTPSPLCFFPDGAFTVITELCPSLLMSTAYR